MKTDLNQRSLAICGYTDQLFCNLDLFQSKRRRLSDGDESDSEDEEEQESTIEATIDGNDKDLLQEDSEEEAEDLSHLSKYEREKKNIKHKITKLEEFNISEKPWQLSGEVRSSARWFKPLATNMRMT